jgi:Tol biopolymer transport system component
LPEEDRRILEGTGSWEAFGWSPDGSQLAVAEWISNAQNYLWHVDVGTGRRTALTVREGPPVRWAAAAFSRDGGSIYALGNFNGESNRLWRRDLKKGEWAAVSRKDEVLEGFAISPDGRTLALVVDRGADSLLRIQDVSGRDRPAVALPPGVISDLLWHPGGREVGFSLSGGRTFHDVYSVNVESGGRAMDVQRNRRRESGSVARRRARALEKLRRSHDSRRSLPAACAIRRTEASDHQRARRAG